MISTFISQACSGGDALIIIPPFGGIDRPSLGAHILQTCARQEGFKVDILYCNLLLAKCIGTKLFEYICYAPTTGLIGERYFSSTAYDLNAVPLYPNNNNTGHIRTSRDTDLTGFLEDYRRSSKSAGLWINSVVDAILEKKYPIIGCSTTFEQTSASIALLNRIKGLSESTVTIIGGANCEDEMAEGIGTLTKSIDYIFSGESEKTFPWFVSCIINGLYPRNRIINGTPLNDLGEIPLVDYKDYYNQSKLLKITKDEMSEVWLPYESSRGCWWGQKRHCLFCGINGEVLKYREKNANQVEYELDMLMKEHPTEKICMVDNIMPYSYFRSLLPKLASRNTKYHFFYEQKANLNLDQVVLLKEAGVNVIQPGIESLSTPLLKHMNKGVTATQNINLLRYARMADLFVNWNILHSFPNDRIDWYESVIDIISCASHLNPPTGSYGLSIDRFSPYFNKSEHYSLSNIRPIHSYKEVFPESSDINRIAYHFEADYPCASRENTYLLDKIELQIQIWREAWMNEQSLPVLHINRLSDDVFLLMDTRVNTPKNMKFTFINKNQAVACLLGKPVKCDNVDVEWALKEKYCILQSQEIIPLATSSIKVYDDLKKEFSKNEKTITSNSKRFCQ